VGPQTPAGYSSRVYLVPKFTLTEGDFGKGAAAADLEAFHLPDPGRPGAVLVVPFTGVADMALVASDHSDRIKVAVRTGISGFMSLGPVGAAAGVIAAGRAPMTVFTVRLEDGRKFTARATAADFADMHAAEVAARGSAAGHRAEALIAKYLAERHAPPAATPVEMESAVAPTPVRRPEPTRQTLPQPTRTFGRRGRV